MPLSLNRSQSTNIFDFFAICFFLLSIFKGFDLPLSFQRFLSPPVVLVTPTQQSPGRPQDSMAIWVEDSLEHGFNVCLRETKIFDGLHQNIKIVSTQTLFLMPILPRLFCRPISLDPLCCSDGPTIIR